MPYGDAGYGEDGFAAAPPLVPSAAESRPPAGTTAVTTIGRPRPSESLFIHNLTVRVATWTTTLGVRTPTYAERPIRAAVQPMRTNRAVRYDTPVGISLFTLYFAEDPATAVDDIFMWGDRSLSALAKPKDQDGNGVLWSVDCREIE
jgi:hypothetical protein